MSRILNPFQLLELTIMSGQELHQVSRKMKTYAVAWIHPNRKLSTRVDSLGHNRPTWNDKFVFRVDEEFLYSDTSAVTIDIYAVHWFRDVLVGTVRVLVGSVAPPRQQQQTRPNKVLRQGNRFLALQVRRPSGRPQGLLNVGVAVLDSSMRSMPLYCGSSAVGYRDLMGEKKGDESSSSDGGSSSMYSAIPNKKQFLLPWIPTPELRRTKSDSSSMLDLPPTGKGKKTGADRIGGGGGGGSMVNGRSRAGSMLTGLESYRNGTKFNKTRSPDSRGSQSDVAGLAQKKKDCKSNQIPLPPGAKFLHGSDTSSSDGFSNPMAVKKPGRPPITDSELGPSASEVAAATVAKIRNLNYKWEEEGSDVVGSWSMESSSMEGLQSKLERWRTDFPPVYAAGSVVGSDPASSSGGGSSMVSGPGGGKRSVVRQGKDGKGAGGFTCLTNICGLQFTIVCGGAAAARRTKKAKKQKWDKSSSISI
ncbi:unnamed protein product [Linum tenue]|uniref:C2 domain-containing protein n=1 Tax=Linum tenue TaxID=586396 RepID=A0AAV0HD04_9ROSI|nr:unnamed protein product [Linum tenue]